MVNGSTAVRLAFLRGHQDVVRFLVGARFELSAAQQRVHEIHMAWQSLAALAATGSLEQENKGFWSIWIFNLFHAFAMGGGYGQKISKTPIKDMALVESLKPFSAHWR